MTAHEGHGPVCAGIGVAARFRPVRHRPKQELRYPDPAFRAGKIRANAGVCHKYYRRPPASYKMQSMKAVWFRASAVGISALLLTAAYKRAEPSSVMADAANAFLN